MDQYHAKHTKIATPTGFWTKSSTETATVDKTPMKTMLLLIRMLVNLQVATLYSTFQLMIKPNGSTRRSIRLTISTIFKLLPGMMRLLKDMTVLQEHTQKGF